MEQESTFGARLRGLMEERGLSYEQLGALLGRNPQTLNRYVLGQREPKIGTAAAIARTLGVDPLWLQGYDVPRTPPAGGGVVPVLGTIRAGLPMAARQQAEGWASADVSEPEEHFFLRVTGDSMINAGICPGDLTLKRFRVQRDMVILQPENPAYEPRIVPLRDFETGAARIVGVAVRLVRNL